MKTVEITIEPKVLTWARESIGKTIDDIAHHLKVGKDVVQQWEIGQKPVRLTQLEKMANYYKRPLAALFLPEPPKEIPLPKDYRTLPLDERKGFSSKTLLAIRRAERVRRLTIEMSVKAEQQINTNIVNANLNDNIEQLGEKVRGHLGIATEAQFKWLDENAAFNEWRNLLERNDILVLQGSVPLEDTRGFSISEKSYPVIFVNKRDSDNGKIFSLFHEYSHLMLNISGICDMAERVYLTEDDRQVETFCNYFAGAFLVPKNSLLGHPLIRKTNGIAFDDEILQELAAQFKVSPEVILRRLVICGKTSNDYYNKKKVEWDEKYKEFAQKKKFGRKVPAKACLQENGRPFVTLVLSSYGSETISLSDVSDYLGIKVKHLPNVEKLIYGKA